MWESRRDFQGVWEGWKAGVLAFHAFHTLSFSWPVLETRFTSSQFAAKALYWEQESLVRDADSTSTWNVAPCRDKAQAGTRSILLRS